MKPAYIIKAIFQGVLFGIFFFAVGVLCFGLPFLSCTSPVDFMYFQATVFFSVIMGMVIGVTWGWGVISLEIDFID